MKYSSFQILLSLLLIIILHACSSGGKERRSAMKSIKPGEINPEVSCESDTLQKYAIFLPTVFSAEKSWPLLICFDPHAEGLLPVQLFRDQAEKHGFIVAGSNNSRNGMPLDETSSIYRKILEDIRSSFPIDTLSVYVAGFSGGSRVAGAVAITEGTIAGVVGCGAGLPNVNRQPVKPFSYLGVAGIQDFNYSELKQVDETLEKAGYIHHFLVFEGNHQWPVKETIPDIFTWLLFDRMRNKTLPTDRNQINEFIDSKYAESVLAGNAGDLLKQLSILIMLKDYLKGLTDIAPLEAEIEHLNQNPRVQQLNEALQELSDREHLLQSEYSDKIQTQGVEWWDKESSKLHTLGDKLPISDESRMFKRILGYLSLSAYMYCNSALKQNDIAAATRFIEIYRLVDPSNSEHRYMAATVSIKQGKKDQAIKELQDAVKLGFKEYIRLKKDTAFTPLHSDKRFMDILNGH